MTNSKERTKTYELPGGFYYLGDPKFVLSSKTLEEFLGKAGEECFLLKGAKVLCIDTGGEKEFPLYDLNPNDAYDDCLTDKVYKGPVHVKNLLVETGRIALIPAEIVELPEWDQLSVDMFDPTGLLDKYGRGICLRDKQSSESITIYQLFINDSWSNDYVDIGNDEWRIPIHDLFMYPDAEEDPYLYESDDDFRYPDEEEEE